MKPVSSGQLSGWSKLRAEDRTAALEMARKAWADEESWSALPEHAQIFAALTLPMVRSVLDPFADTVKCLNCSDSGFQSGKVYGVWFCAACDKGLVLEAGYWRRVRFPQVRGRRIASAKGKREFELYSASKPHRAERVRAEISRLVRQEQERAERETES